MHPDGSVVDHFNFVDGSNVYSRETNVVPVLQSAGIFEYRGNGKSLPKHILPVSYQIGRYE